MRRWLKQQIKYRCVACAGKSARRCLRMLHRCDRNRRIRRSRLYNEFRTLNEKGQISGTHLYRQHIRATRFRARDGTWFRSREEAILHNLSL